MKTDGEKSKHGIRWLRVFIAGLCIEVVLVVASVVLFTMERPDLVEIIIAPATLVAAFFFGAWAAKGTRDRFVLHGSLAGGAALLIYVALIVGASLTAFEADTSSILSLGYLASHLFKILGGALGGYFVGRGGHPKRGDLPAA